ncbi:hypothetical protein R3P38DRAFT_2832766 [Favolaschia claudopus]|uniref:Uncharacterized protein n=1 Tax=Favolaschia claudopus TaxID=2862362 RepID=A0AAW0EEW9_9AGAR
MAGYPGTHSFRGSRSHNQSCLCCTSAKEMSSPTASTVSLASTTTVTSRMPLNASKATRPKDFRAAFAKLQSSHGFNGAAPVLGHKNTAAPSVKYKAHAQKATKENTPSPSANLQPALGPGGTIPIPSPIPSSKPQKPKKTSLFSGVGRWLARPSTGSSPTLAGKPKARAVPQPSQTMILL